MRPGSPGFLGERLREAREARGLTGIALADLLGVSRQAVSQYEKGDASPAPAVLEKLARALNVREAFFRRPAARPEIGSVFYRSFASATKTARLRAERRYGWLKEIVTYVEERVELPMPDFPDAQVDPLRLTDTDIERIAIEVRKHFGLGLSPIPNMVVLLENRGAVLSRCLLGTETLDAFSEWSVEDGRPYFVLSADKASAARSRLDAAHELGHMVLHRNLPKSSLAETATFRLIESQAFRFAGAFLLPAQEFADDFFLPDLSELKRLKEKWGVAMAAVIKRCEHLELLPESEITRLWVAMSRSGWRKREPLDDEMEPEQPRVLRDSFELLLEHKIRTRVEIRHALPFSEKDIEELAGLPAGFFEEPPLASVVELKSRAALSSETQGGRVVPFPSKGRE
jgi:Zn-dependent peptidase ImmA (M78 family)